MEFSFKEGEKIKVGIELEMRTVSRGFPFASVVLLMHNTLVACTERYGRWVPSVYANGVHFPPPIHG